MQLAMREWRLVAGWRGLSGALVAGLLLGFAGPFGSQTTLPPLVRYGFWLGIALSGYAAALAADRLLPSPFPAPRAAMRPGQTPHPLYRLTVVALASALPMTFVAAWAMGLVRPGRSFTALQLLALFPYVALVQLLIARAAAVAPPAPTPAADAHGTAPQPDPAPNYPPDFLVRLPVALRHDIVALEAEDHYLRVHAAGGSTLVLMRLADAAAMIDPRLGLRVHRSWWVARDRVDALDAASGRPALRLSNGLTVPVSRTYLAAVRAALAD